MDLSDHPVSARLLKEIDSEPWFIGKAGSSKVISHYGGTQSTMLLFLEKVIKVINKWWSGSFGMSIYMLLALKVSNYECVFFVHIRIDFG